MFALKEKHRTNKKLFNLRILDNCIHCKDGYKTQMTPLKLTNHLFAGSFEDLRGQEFFISILVFNVVILYSSVHGF